MPPPPVSRAQLEDKTTVGSREICAALQHCDHPAVVHLRLPTVNLFREQAHDIANYEEQLRRLRDESLRLRYTRDWTTRTLRELAAAGKAGA